MSPIFYFCLMVFFSFSSCQCYFLGAIIYIWYCVVTLYKEMKAEEEANTGVQMAYVDETTNQRNQLPPYSVLTIDK